MTRPLLLHLLTASLLLAAGCSLLEPPIELPQAQPPRDAGDTSDTSDTSDDAEPPPDRDDLDAPPGPRDELAIPPTEAPHAARLVMLPHTEPGASPGAPLVASLTLQRVELQGEGFPERFPTSAEQLVLLLGGTGDATLDGVPVPFELEHLDAERLTIWVRLPTMERAYSLDLYWTDAGSLEDRHSSTAIWEDYAVVLHFDADAPTHNSAGGTSVELMDGARVQAWSSSDPALYGDRLALVEGGWAVIPDDRALVIHPLNDLSALTVEVTFRQLNGRDAPSPLLWHEWSCFGWRLETINEAPQALATLGGAVCDGGGRLDTRLHGAALSEGSWHTLTLVQDRREPPHQAILYLDGQPLAKEMLPPLPAEASAGQGPLHIGASWDLMQRFQGELDEVRIYLGARDEAWVRGVEALRRGTVQRVERLR